MPPSKLTIPTKPTAQKSNNTNRPQPTIQYTTNTTRCPEHNTNNNDRNPSTFWVSPHSAVRGLDNRIFSWVRIFVWMTCLCVQLNLMLGQMWNSKCTVWSNSCLRELNNQRWRWRFSILRKPTSVHIFFIFLHFVSLFVFFLSQRLRSHQSDSVPWWKLLVAKCFPELYCETEYCLVQTDLTKERLISHKKDWSHLYKDWRSQLLKRD